MASQLDRNYLTVAELAKMKFKLSVFTLYGIVEVGEDELPTLTNKALAKLRISREELCRCFAEGVKLIEGRGDSDRACAYETYDGKWEVRIVRDPTLSNLLIEDIK